MKFHTESINERGAVVRCTLSAESREQVRELLLAESLFVKRIDPAPDDAPVTWTPKDAGVERLRAVVHGRATATGASPAAKVVASASTTLLASTDRPARRGSLTVYDDGRLVFEATGAPALKREIAPAEVEIAALTGFPARRLNVSLLSGELVEFTAGLLVSGAAYKRAVALLEKSREAVP